MRYHASGIPKPRNGAKLLALMVAIACVRSCASLSSHVVTTAEELHLAIGLEGEKHVRIEIKEHIDLGEWAHFSLFIYSCTTDFTIWVRFLT